MEKPITLVREEFKDNLVSLVNNSGLPAFMMLDLIDDLRSVLSDISEKQLREDRKKYEESLKKN